MGAPTSYILQGDTPGAATPNAAPIYMSSHDVTFSVSGLLIATTVGRYPIAGDSHIVRSLSTLLVAGSTATTVQVRLNGVAIGTITIPANQTGPIQTAWDFSAADASTMQANIITAGTNAQGLVVVFSRETTR